MKRDRAIPLAQLLAVVFGCEATRESVRKYYTRYRELSDESPGFPRPLPGYGRRLFFSEAQVYAWLEARKEAA